MVDYSVQQMQVLSIKSRSKSLSPTKRRLIISDDDCKEAESTNVEQPKHSEQEESRTWKPNFASRTPRKSNAMYICGGEESSGHTSKESESKINQGDTI